MVTSPITGTTDVTVLESIPTAPLIAGWQQQFGIDVAEEFHGFEAILRCRCDRTGLEFFRPVEVAGTAALYGRLQQHDWYYLTSKWEHEMALADLRGFEKVLEVGCGSGNFIARARATGFNARGIEMNPDAVRAARQRNLPIELMSLTELASTDAGAFDAVCSFQVLEHIAEPRPFLEDSLRLLRPGGRLLCAVPNQDSFLRHEDNLLNLPPHHMLRWTASAFRALEQFLPVQLDRVLCEPLSTLHVPCWVRAQARRWRNDGWPGRLVFNRFTMPVAGILLNAGLRRLMIGHTLYVVFTKRT
jgi:SAM-dependent methyltransferase